MSKVLPAIALAGVFSAVGLTGLAQAPMPPAPIVVPDTTVMPTTPAEAHEARRIQMEYFGAILTDVLRGRTNRIQAMERVAAGFGNIANLYREGTRTEDALPNIWTDWDNFLAIANRAKTVAEEGLAFARVNNIQQLNLKIRELSDVCTSCHDKYRGDIEVDTPPAGPLL